MNYSEAIHKGETVISLPKWVWGAITSLLGVLLAGAMAWATWMTGSVNEVRFRVIDRKEVEQMIESTGPYTRDRANIEARMQIMEKATDRHEADARRLSETLARVEAKLDLAVGQKKSPP